MAANEEPCSGARAVDRAAHVLNRFGGADPQVPVCAAARLTRRRTVDLMRLASATCRG